MSFARPGHEDVFVMNYLKKEIQALGVDAEMQQKFINYAAKEAHADLKKFKARLYHVVNGRTPSTYIALLLVDFFRGRKYEDFIRKITDHVEYITSDGKTEELEQLVSKHPLQLRIVKVEYHKTEYANSIDIVLRTPIKVPDWEKLDEKAVGEQFEAKYQEFQKWLLAQEKLPTKLSLRDGETVELNYKADFFSSESDFVEDSNLSGVVDIGRGVDLMLLCSLKDKAPCIRRQGLDLFYELVDVLGRGWADKKANDFSAKELWGKLSKDVDCLPLVFYQEQHFFSPASASTLDNFFNEFAKRHKKLTDRAIKDWKEMEKQDESYRAKPEVFRLYEDARQDFSKLLLPLLNKNKNQIVTAFRFVLEVYHKRAQKHFSKLRGAFEGKKQ